jgi:hypothetical protein
MTNTQNTEKNSITLVGAADVEPEITAEVDFFFCNHSTENLPKIADALITSDADIFAIEKIREGTFGMGTEQEKKELSERMTSFIAADNPTAQTAGEYFGTQEPLFTLLLDGLKGSGKKIVLLDMGIDNEQFPVYSNRVAVRQSYIDSQKDPSVTQEELDDLEIDNAIAGAQSNEVREVLMEQQIMQLVEENPDAKISVMVGALHTAISFNMRSLAKTKRHFILSDAEESRLEHGKKIRFSDQGCQSRAMRLKLGNIGLSLVQK